MAGGFFISIIRRRLHEITYIFGMAWKQKYRLLYNMFSYMYTQYVYMYIYIYLYDIVCRRYKYM